MALARDDDVIEQRVTEQLAGLRYITRQLQIQCAGLQRTRWVVVNQENAGAVRKYRAVEDFADADDHLVAAADRNNIPVGQPAFTIQRACDHHFAVKLRHILKCIRDVVRGTNFRTVVSSEFGSKVLTQTK